MKFIKFELKTVLGGKLMGAGHGGFMMFLSQKDITKLKPHKSFKAIEF